MCEDYGGYTVYVTSKVYVDEGWRRPLSSNLLTTKHTSIMTLGADSLSGCHMSMRNDLENINS